MRSRQQINHLLNLWRVILKESTKSYKVTAKGNIHGVTFLHKSRLKVLNLLEINRKTEVQWRSDCIMVRTDMTTGEDETDKTGFWSDTVEHYPSTDLR